MQFDRDDRRWWRDRAAIVGVGYSDISKQSGTTTSSLAVRAIRDAVRDAGLQMSDIDGLATHQVMDCVNMGEIAAALGVTDVSWFHDESGGGAKAPAVVAQAALACGSGAVSSGTYASSALPDDVPSRPVMSALAYPASTQITFIPFPH